MKKPQTASTKHASRWVADASHNPDSLFTSEKAIINSSSDEEVQFVDAAVNPVGSVEKLGVEDPFLDHIGSAVFQKDPLPQQNLQALHNSPIGMHDFYDLHY